MLKEIFEQPDCIKDCMRGRVSIDGSDIALSAIIDNKKRLLSARRFIIVACGTPWHAALIGKYLIEQFCRFPVEVEYASEFRYRNPVINENDVVIAISQSGETADTLAAIEEARKRGAFVYRYLQRHRLIDRPGHRHGIVHTRRARNRCGVDQSIHGTSYGTLHAGTFAGSCQRLHFARRIAKDRLRAESDTR